MSSERKGSLTDKLKNVFHHKKDGEHTNTTAVAEEERGRAGPEPGHSSAEGQKKEGEFQKFENYVKKSQAEEARDQQRGDEYGGDM